MADSKHDQQAQTTGLGSLQSRAAEREHIRREVARMLYESGEMMATWEGGPPPTWDEVMGLCEFADIRLSHLHRADCILDLGAAECVELSRILMGIAATKYAAFENDMWAKVERAKGFEPGSLRGWPNVKQMVAL